MNKAQRRRIRTVLQALRSECPALLPIRVIFRKRAASLHVCGWSSINRRGDEFRIVVCLKLIERGAEKARSLFTSEIIDVLIHEWAHCVAWNSGHSELQDHPDAWGMAYAMCYRTVIED